MNNWRAVGYIFLGVGSVLLIYALFVFLGMMSVFSQTHYGAQLSMIALAAIAPYLVLSSIAYVIGGVSYYVGRESVAAPIVSDKTNEATRVLLDKIERLEGIVDNNFNVITKRLDEIEERQNMALQNTIIKAKKE